VVMKLAFRAFQDTPSVATHLFELSNDEFRSWKRVYGFERQCTVDEVVSSVEGGSPDETARQRVVLLHGVQEVASFPAIRAGLLEKKWTERNLSFPPWWNLLTRSGQGRVIALSDYLRQKNGTEWTGHSGTWGSLGAVYTRPLAETAASHGVETGPMEGVLEWVNDWHAAQAEVRLFNPDFVADPKDWVGLHLPPAERPVRKARRGGKESRRRHNAKRYAQTLIKIEAEGGTNDWANGWIGDVHPQLKERAREYLPPGWELP